MWNNGRNTRVNYIWSHCFTKLHIHPGGRGANSATLSCIHPIVMDVKYIQKCTSLHFISEFKVPQGGLFVCIFTISILRYPGPLIHMSDILPDIAFKVYVIQRIAPPVHSLSIQEQKATLGIHILNLYLYLHLYLYMHLYLYLYSYLYLYLYAPCQFGCADMCKGFTKAQLCFQTRLLCAANLF